MVIGILATAWGYPRYKRLLWWGLGLMVAVGVLRVVLINQNRAITLITLPKHNTLCVLGCLIEEQDAALISTRLLPLIGWISPNEQIGLLDAMYAQYRDMAHVQALVPSPFIRTYLNLQHADEFDAVVIEPDTQQTMTTGIIFLHGFTGNFTMPCWLMAQTVREFQALTVCPSVGWKGDWWTANGEATLRTTIDYLHQRGVNKLYLAGLSNGAVGASELAHKLSNTIDGLILISGASMTAQDSGLPVLVLGGNQDERMPSSMLRDYANQIGSKASFIELEGDHFLLAKQFNSVQQQISTWIKQH